MALKRLQASVSCILFAISAVVPPLHLDFVRAEALSERALAQRHAFLTVADELEDAGVGDHGSIIDAVAVVHRAD